MTNIHPLNRRLHLLFLLVVVVVVTTAALLFSQTIEAQTSSRITYSENDTGPVVTLRASDPEGASTTVWDLLPSANVSDVQDINGDGTDDVLEADVADNALFTISDGGVLSFVSPPNFEMPARYRRQQ